MEPPKNNLYEENITQHKNKDDNKACKKNINPNDAKKQENFIRNVFGKQEKVQLRYDIENHDAGVYNEAAYNKQPGSVQETLPPPGNIEGGNREVVEVAAAGGSGDDGGVRITTLARMTYELDRYSKNAMLIINYDSDDNTDVLKIKNVFEKYRFEVENITPVTFGNDFIPDTTAITAFFEKDFTNYGALAVFVIRDYRKNIENTNRYERSLLPYFCENLPASLKEKPIIFFKEDANIFLRPIDLVNYPNTLQFLYPDTTQDNRKLKRLVLHKLLDKINELADDNDLLSVFTEASRDCVDFLNDTRTRRREPCVLPWICSTLLKEIRLARSPL